MLCGPDLEIVYEGLERIRDHGNTLRDGVDVDRTKTHPIVNFVVIASHVSLRVTRTPNGSFRIIKEPIMPNRSAIANGADPVQQKAAADADAVQNAVNLVAVVGCFHGHLLALHRSGVCGDDLISHPVSLAFTSKLNSLCRMTLDRETAAFSAIDRIQKGEAVEYEVIPL